MKCEKCVALGLKSKLTPGPSRATLMYFAPWFDEDGAYHNHDYNTTTTEYSCSNGHHTVVKSTPSCPSCGPLNGR